MKLLAAFFRALFAPSMSIYTEQLHARFISDWINKPDLLFVHPDCTWTLAKGHPHQGVYAGPDFYESYAKRLGVSYSSWNQEVTQIIGSSIGAIVVGTYQFQRKGETNRHSAPFTHFYRIHQRKIVHAQYFIGEISIRLQPSRHLMDLFPLNQLPSLN